MKTIQEGLNEAYESFGSNTYFDDVFIKGVEFSQRWISVDDELPKYDTLDFENKVNVKFVDIHNKEQICTAILCQVSQHCGENSPMIDTWYVYPSGGHRLRTVTHWRPITVS